MHSAVSLRVCFVMCGASFVCNFFVLIAHHRSIHHKVEAVAELDEIGTIVSVNDNFLPLFGYRKEELISMLCAICVFCLQLCVCLLSVVCCTGLTTRVSVSVMSVRSRCCYVDALTLPRTPRGVYASIHAVW
mgnify:CR=1 FL=1